MILRSALELPEIFYTFAKHFTLFQTADLALDPQLEEEEFQLDLDGEEAKISSGSRKGLFYGLQELLSQSPQMPSRKLCLKRKPAAPERVLKLYLPPPTEEGLEEFRRIVYFAARCKFNAVMLELGGALEYKSHPEINEGWLHYAEIMNEYPGKTLEIRDRFPWCKNSIHTENGGGKIVPQEMFLKLVEICHSVFMEVIPEMPSLSHSDYLLTRHPELAERPSDPYPDCCCPQDPGYHRLFDDLLDEVIVLLHPARIHIGHDEYYSVGLCPRCKGIPPAELYAQDIDRIGFRLRKQNIIPVIWGENLLDSHWKTGEPIGGAEKPESTHCEGREALHPSADLIRCQPEIYHWYWNVDRTLEKVYEEREMPYVFANLNPPVMPDWENRISAPFARGVCISNWGSTNCKTLQRNGIFYELAYAEKLLWTPWEERTSHPETDQAVFHFLYREFTPQTTENERLLQITHTTSTPIRFQYFFDGFLLDENFFLLGWHVFFLEETKEIRKFPVIFGTNISNRKMDPSLKEDPSGLSDAFFLEHQYKEISCSTLPEQDENGHFWYHCRYLVPATVRNVRYLRFEPLHALVPEVAVKNFSLL